jgi:hypothetical protein
VGASILEKRIVQIKLVISDIALCVRGNGNICRATSFLF